MSAGQEPEEAGQLAGKQCAHVKKRSVLKSTFDKWIVENDKGLNTPVWLRYDTNPGDYTRVVTLKCVICTRFKDRLVGQRNYSTVFVEGSVNLGTSSFKDHAASDMHSCACCSSRSRYVPASSSLHASCCTWVEAVTLLFQESTDVCRYAPIAASLFAITLLS